MKRLIIKKVCLFLLTAAILATALPAAVFATEGTVQTPLSEDTDRIITEAEDAYEETAETPIPAIEEDETSTPVIEEDETPAPVILSEEPLTDETQETADTETGILPEIQVPSDQPEEEALKDEPASLKEPLSDEELTALYDTEDGLIVFADTLHLLKQREQERIALLASDYTPSSPGSSNPVVGVTLNSQVRWTGMDAWWESPNGLLSFDSNWTRFYASKISQLKPGDVIEWYDDYRGCYVNHIAIVAYVASDNSWFTTVDGNAGGETGVSFITHYNLYKGNSSYGVVNIWRNQKQGDLIASSAIAFANQIIETNNTGMIDYYWGYLGINWCYCFVVEALLHAGNGFSLYEIPALNPCKSTNEGIFISWKPVAFAESYCVFYKDTANDKWVKIKTTRDTSFHYTEAKHGKKYIFTVAAKGSSGTGRRDKAGVLGVFLKGTKVTAKTAKQVVQLSWDPVGHAAGYLVYGSTDGENWTKIADTAQTEYQDTEYLPGKTNRYLVRAYVVHKGKKYLGYQNKSLYAAEVPIPHTTVLSSVQSRKGRLVLKWKEVKKADHYRIYRKEEGSSWKRIGKTSFLFYEDKEIRSGTVYQYRVSAFNKEGYEGPRSKVSEKRIYVPMPKITVCKNTKAGIVLKWEESKRLNACKVYRRKPGEKWVRLATVAKEGNYVDSTAQPAEEYEYLVRGAIVLEGSCQLSGYGPEDAVSIVRKQYPTAEAAFTQAVSLPKIRTRARQASYGTYVYWAETEGAKYYNVYRRIPGEGWHRIAYQTQKNRYADKTAKKGVCYDYLVRAAIESDGNIKLTPYTDSCIATLTLLEPPSGVTVKSTEEGLQFQWNKVKNATGYDVFRYVSADGTWKLLGSVKETSFLFKHPKVGHKYTFSVAAKCASNPGWKDEKGYPGAWLDAVKLSTISATSEGTKITWEKKTGATGYRIFRKAAGGSWKALKNTRARSFNDLTGEKGVKYYYTVKAFRRIDQTTCMGICEKPGLSAVYKRDNAIVIMLDPGHDSTHAGCSNAWATEHVITLKIAQACKAELETYRNVKVYLTRTTASCPYPGSMDTGHDIMQRVQDAVSKKADSYVSLHINASGGGQRGVMIIPQVPTWRKDLSAKSLAIGNCIKKELMKLGLGDDGVYYRYATDGSTYPDGSTPDYFAVTYYGKKNGIASLIMEHGFIDNEDYAWMDTDADLKKLGIADATGIAAYYGFEKK